MWKPFKDSLKELSIALIILGLSRELIYYRNFDLPIKYFLSLSELWLVISDDLIYTAPFIFLLVFANHKIKDSTEPKTLKRSLFEKIMIGIFIGIGFLILIEFFRSDSYQQRLIFGLSMVIFIIIFIPVLIPNNLSMPLKQYFPFFSISLFVCLIIFIGIIEIGKAEHGRYKGTVITTERKTYISNDSIYFIGKTDKYVFIHDESRNSNYIIPIGLVTEIEIKVNHTFTK